MQVEKLLIFLFFCFVLNYQQTTQRITSDVSDSYHLILSHHEVYLMYL